MSLKPLNINFRSLNDLFNQLDNAVINKQPLIDRKDVIYFDSEKSYQKFMGPNKQQILKAISRLRPISIYQLAQYLER
jgi:predicted transcriptional regulator